MSDLLPGIKGGLASTVAEEREHETQILARRITEIPSNQQAHWVYDGSNNCIYAGYAARGVSDSTNGWLLHKYTYDANNNATRRLIAYDSWDNYLTASYS